MTNGTAKKREKFLRHLEECGSVRRAARAANIGRNTVYVWRRKQPEFAAEWKAALEVAADLLQDEAFRRAHEGVDEPVFYQGKQVDTVKRYSDSLLMFLLKGLKPEKYRDRIEQTATVDVAALIAAGRRRARVAAD